MNLAGFNPFTIMGTEDGQYGYRMQVITHKHSDVEAIEDLSGKTGSHTEQASNSGNQAPRAILSSMGVTPGDDYEVVYSGDHDQSILGVANRDYVAAPVASSVLDRMAERGVVDTANLGVVYESQPFPTTAFGHAHNFDPALRLLVQKAFFTFDFEGNTVGEKFSAASSRSATAMPGT